MTRTIFLFPLRHAVVLAGICACLSGPASAQQTGDQTKFSDFVTARAASKLKFEAKDFLGSARDMEAALALAKTPEERGIAMVRIGQSYSSAGDAVKAREWWQKTIKEPKIGETEKLQAQLMLGQSWADEKQFEKAIQTVESLTKDKDEEKRFFAIILTAFARHSLGDYAQGRTLLLNELKAPGLDDSIRVFLLTNLAQMAMAGKRYRDARESLDQALKLEVDLGTLAVFQRMIGMSYSEEKKYAAARTVYQSILETAIPPEASAEIAQKMVKQKSDALHLIARTYRDEGNKAAAKEAYNILLNSPLATTADKELARKELEALK